MRRSVVGATFVGAGDDAYMYSATLATTMPASCVAYTGVLNMRADRPDVKNMEPAVANTFTRLSAVVGWGGWIGRS